MSEDPNVNPTQEPIPDPPTPPAPPAAEPSEDYRHKFESADGRLRQMSEALKAAGYSFDGATNQFVQIGTPQQQYTPPVQTPEPGAEDEILYDPQKMRAYVQDQIREGVQAAMGTLVPILNDVNDTVLGVRHNDWSDIKDGVMARARELGINTITALKTQPALMSNLIEAERGKRVLAAQQDPQAEIARLQRIVTATTAGNPANAPAPHPSGYQFTDEEREFMKARNMTEDQYLDYIAEPAQIKFGGEK